MFKFNFQVAEDVSSKKDKSMDDISVKRHEDEEDTKKIMPPPPVPPLISKKNKNNVIKWLTAKEHRLNEEHLDRLSNLELYDQFIMENLNLLLVDGEEVGANVIAEKESLTQTIDSDLVKGIYEGGLKIWECSIDLAKFLYQDVPKSDLEGKSILEIGCGAGLPGLTCFVARGASVDFQDYNPEVIDYLTIPNVLFNVPNSPGDEEAPETRFFSGDWESFTILLSTKLKRSYDVILTSETIYNLENQSKLINLFDNTLKSNGVIYLASKIHYFGVGGGLRQFESLLKDKWNFETVKTFDVGVSREILKINRK